jgi:hypothetical protein
MHITFYGPRMEYEGFSEQYFMTVCRYRGHWLILETGWDRVGKQSQYSKFIYAPFHFGSDIETRPDGGRIYIYTSWQKYIKDCTVHPSAIVDGVPMLWWASYCRLN